MSEPFAFLDPGILVDDNLMLVLASTHPAVPERGRVPYYRFEMRHSGTGERMGRLHLRVGHSLDVEQYAGHIGYAVEPAHRGHHYAARSCRLVFAFALRHGLSPLWITCDPDNWASRRTCELAGGELVEIVDTPPGSEYRRDGEPQKCRYCFDLGALQD